jgi:hypothetical protein
MTTTVVDGVLDGFVTSLTSYLSTNLPTVLLFVAGAIALFFFIALLKRGMHGH